MNKSFEVDVIKQEAELHGLTGLEKIYFFYYDETGNPRKFYLKEGGFNRNEPENFILGGFVQKENICFNLDDLKSNIKDLSKNNVELKWAIISCKRKKLDILGSKNLKIFLEWLPMDNFFIHLSILEPTFFSYADIIDSVIPEDIYFYHLKLKSDLTKVFNANLSYTIQVLNKYSYPSVSHENKNFFIKDISDIIENSSALDSYDKMFLKGIIQQGLKKDSLDFIDGDGKKRDCLIDSFFHFYRHSSNLFSNSQHFFDEERQIEEYMNNLDNVHFLNSKTEPKIQICDVIVGLFGQILKALAEKNINEIREEKNKFTQIEKENFHKISILLKRSIQENSAFLHRIMSGYDQEKFDVFFDL